MPVGHLNDVFHLFVALMLCRGRTMYSICCIDDVQRTHCVFYLLHCAEDTLSRKGVGHSDGKQNAAAV